MHNSAEILYAHWATPFLANARGLKWRELIERVAPLDEMHPDALALSLLMIRVNDCIKCNARRYRERGGCANCSLGVLGTSDRPTEEELMARFTAAQVQVLESQQADPSVGMTT